jgi:hypothetical protein
MGNAYTITYRTKKILSTLPGRNSGHQAPVSAFDFLQVNSRTAGSRQRGCHSGRFQHAERFPHRAARNGKTFGQIAPAANI